MSSSGGSCGEVAKLCADETESGETAWLDNAVCWADWSTNSRTIVTGDKNSRGGESGSG